MYGSYVKKLECANHAVKCYRGRLKELAKNNPQYQGKGGLTKRAIQRLTVGAQIAIQMHSKDMNVQQLRHDLRNGPAHVFGDHSSCNPLFCKNTVQPSQFENSTLEGETSHDNPSSSVHQGQPTSLVDLISNILTTETENEPTPEMEETAHNGYSAPLSRLPDGLLRKVLACGDRLVMLAPQLINNLTSNLAECYMGLRAICDGGKQYNRIQSGSFQHRCYIAGLQAQNGPQWKVQFWEETISEPASQVYKKFIITLYSTYTQVCNGNLITTFLTHTGNESSC